MTRTGPQKIPGALLDLFFGDGRYSGSDMEVNCGCLHTTEGPTLYDYDGGSVAPTVTGVPDMARKAIVWHQHFDVDESARALVHASGQPATNTANVFQIELVGTCDPANATTWRLGSKTLRAGVDYIYWPQAPDWALAGLAWLMRWLRDNHGIPLTSGLTWRAYPGSSGIGNGVRMTQAQWSRFTGWCGHQHVPQNDHGDPGDIAIGRLLALAAGTSTPTVQEDDMTPDQIAAAPVPFRGGDGKQPPVMSNVGDFLNSFTQSFARVEAALAAQTAVVQALVGQLGQVHGVDTASVIAAVQSATGQAVDRYFADATVTFHGGPAASKEA